MKGALPVVSVVMPAYNAAETITDAIESVVTQTFPHWELLIVVDAATDDTLTIANRWARQDSRIRVFFNDINTGVARSRNLAMDHAVGQYLAFLDSDDLWLPEKLAFQVDFMTRSGTELCYGAYERFSKHGERRLVVPQDQVSRSELLRGNIIPNLTGVVSRKLVADLRFQPIGHEDYVFWLSVLQRTPVARRLPARVPIARYRVHAASLSSRKWQNLGWQWRIYRQTLGLSWLHSATLMMHYATRALLKRTIGNQRD